MQTTPILRTALALIRSNRGKTGVPALKLIRRGISYIFSAHNKVSNRTNPNLYVPHWYLEGSSCSGFWVARVQCAREICAVCVQRVCIEGSSCSGCWIYSWIRDCFSHCLLERLLCILKACLLHERHYNRLYFKIILFLYSSCKN